MKRTPSTQVEADAETIREGLAILAERDALATKVCLTTSLVSLLHWS